MNTNCESMAYRSFSPLKFNARGVRKVTTGMNTHTHTHKPLCSPRGWLTLAAPSRASFTRCAATHLDAGTSCLSPRVPSAGGNSVVAWSGAQSAPRVTISCGRDNQLRTRRCKPGRTEHAKVRLGMTVEVSTSTGSLVKVRAIPAGNSAQQT